MSMKKKTVIAAVVALMLCLAVYLNVNYSGRENEEGVDAMSTTENYGDSHYVSTTADDEAEDAGLEIKEGAEYFAETKLNRERARDEALSLMQQTMLNAESTDEAKNKASDAISKLAENAMQEARIEGLVTAKGFEQCVAFIGANSLSVVVSSPADGLKAGDVVKIKDIVMSESQVSAETINVIPVR